jgi:hypothetical protein
VPSLSTSKGEDKIVISKPETIRGFEALYIVRALEKMETTAERKAELKQYQELSLKIFRRYGAEHVDADGYPKETQRQAAANKL